MAKKATPKAPSKMKAVKEKMTKSQMIEALSGDSGLSKKEVSSVLGSLERLIEASIGKRAAGEFHLARLDENHHGPQARGKGTQGYQPLHRGRDYV
jgi:hypothetical protein